MNTTSRRTLHIIEQIVKPVPIGTNLGLLQLIWAMISGAFLPARGAVHSALTLAGFEPQETQRGWAALRYGVWNIQELLARYHHLVQKDGRWQSQTYQGYRPIAVDLTAIWRPRLQNWTLKVYRQLTGKAFVGVGYGLICQVGMIESQRIPLLTAIVRGQRGDENEENLKAKTLAQAAQHLGVDGVLVHDAGITLKQIHKAKIERFVLRLPLNCTARRNKARAYKGRGAYPTKGEIVRPLERRFKDNLLANTPEDVTVTFEFEARTIEARGWLNVVRSELNAAPDNDLYSIWVIDDPLFEGVLPLGTNLPQEVTPSTLYQLFIDRWPVEQVPLVAKQLLGCQRQFVFSTTSCWRLGELAFFVGNLLTWLAATSPAYPTGYWDRNPKKRRGDSEDSWQGRIYQQVVFLTPEFAESGRLQLICPRALQLTAVQLEGKQRNSAKMSIYCYGTHPSVLFEIV